MINIKNAETNGVSLGVFNTDRFKSETLSLYLRLPVSKEESLIRSLLLSVLKRGCEKYPSQKDINLRLDELYASIITLENRKYDSEQLFGLSLDVVKSRYTDDGEDLLRGALNVACEMLFHPLLDENGFFSEDYVSSEKQNYKNVILSQMNEPRSYASIRCREETLAELGASYRLSETLGIIDAITPADLTDYYKSIMRSAEFRAFYVGERSPEEIIKVLCDVLPDAKNCDLEFCDRSRTLSYAAEQRIVEERDLSQSRLVISVNCATRTRDDDHRAMLVCNEILGASPISKLMMQVRERLGLCYECSSVYDGARGVIFINSGIDTLDAQLAESAIREQIDALVRGDISDEELIAAKKSIINIYKGVYDSPSAIERFYISRAIRGVEESVEDAIAGVEAVSLDGVIAAAQKLCVHTVYFLKGREECEVDSNEE